MVRFVQANWTLTARLLQHSKHFPMPSCSLPEIMESALHGTLVSGGSWPTASLGERDFLWGHPRCYWQASGSTCVWGCGCLDSCLGHVATIKSTIPLTAKQDKYKTDRVPNTFRAECATPQLISRGWGLCDPERTVCIKCRFDEK